MPKERIREPLAGLLQPNLLEDRVKAGWKLVGIEWERDAPASPPLAEALSEAAPAWVEEIPYGLRVSDDCTGLVANPAETEIIILALDMIVDDRPLSRVAENLNLRGYRTRQGEAWTPAAIFELLPRMIQVGPRVFATEEWHTRRQRLPKLA
jgi:hypothetical protein